jgi:hypothetical protein
MENEPVTVQMFGVVGPPHNGPLALFPDEHAAWRWLLNHGGERVGTRGWFAPPADDLRVRPFTVSVTG